MLRAMVKDHKGRVLFISPQPFFEWRGTPIRISFNLRALVEMGYTVDLLTFPVGADLDIPGVRIVRVPNLLGVKKISIGPSLPKAFLDVLMLFWAVAMALRHRYRFIHGVEEGGAIGVVAAFVSRCCLFFEKHSDPASYKGGGIKNVILWLYDRVERITARYASSVIATGPGLAEQVRRLAGKTRVYHIFDIPSSLVEPDADAIREARQRMDPEGSHLLLTYVGSFAVYQGVDLLFDSIPRVMANHPQARFVIIGGSPENIAIRQRWLADRSLTDAVIFMGSIAPDTLPNYLSASDVLLSPRLMGVNTPLKVLDYLKSGRAIMATDTEANRLILSPSTACLAAPERDAFADGLCRLIADADLREQLGRAGRRLIDETYNFTQFKRRLEDCYRGGLPTLD